VIVAEHDALATRKLDGDRLGPVVRVNEETFGVEFGHR